MAYRWTLTNLSDSSTEVLSKDPIGWDEGIYKITRSEKYKGAFQEYTTSLKFHCDGGGKQFIDNVYQTEDIDGRIQILCEYDCDGSGTFDTLFDSIINLASYKEDGQFTTVNIERSDLLTKLNSRDEIKIDLETTTSLGGETITAPNSTILPLTPVEIYLESKAELTEAPSVFTTETFDIQVGFTSTGFFANQFFLAGAELEDFTPWFNFGQLAVNLNTGNVILSEVLHANSTNYGYPLGVDVDAKFNVVITPYPRNPSMSYSFTASLVMAYGANLYDAQKVNIWNDTFVSGVDLDLSTGIINFLYSGQILQLNKGDKIWFYWAITNLLPTASDGSPDNIYFTFEYFGYGGGIVSEIQLSSLTTFRETESNTFLVHEAFNQVVDAIADSDNNFESDFYGRTDSDKVTYAQDGFGSLIAITNGLNIREFTGKSIFCSLKDLFDTFNALHNIGLGIVNNKVRVEPLSYWFDNTTEIISLPNVNNYETRNDNTRYFNNIQIGYDSWETEFKGGLDEPCTRHEYSTKIASAKNIYTQLSRYIASSYAIELTRRKNINIIPTEDWQYDNDNFIIALTRTSYGYGDALMPEIYSDSFSVGSGMQALDTAYNLRLTPKRMLLAHMNIITAGLQLINGFVKFIRGDGNTDLQVAKDNVGCQEDFNGQVLGENDDLIWDESNVANIAPLWLPEIYTFEYPLTYTQFKTIKANPYGYISFYKFANEVKKGFLMNLEYNMKTGLTSFTLLKMYE